MIGDILLVKNNTYFGGLIRKAVRSNYNHVGMFVDDEYLIEAKMRGVEKTHISHFQELQTKGELEFIVCRFKKMSPGEKETMKNWLYQQIGCKYDFLQMIIVGLYLLFRIKRIYPPLDISKAFICSELIGEALHQVNQTFQPHIHYENTNPADIAYSSLIVQVRE